MRVGQRIAAALAVPLDPAQRGVGQRLRQILVAPQRRPHPAQRRILRQSQRLGALQPQHRILIVREQRQRTPGKMRPRLRQPEQRRLQLQFVAARRRHAARTDPRRLFVPVEQHRRQPAVPLQAGVAEHQQTAVEAAGVARRQGAVGKSDGAN